MHGPMERPWSEIGSHRGLPRREPSFHSLLLPRTSLGAALNQANTKVTGGVVCGTFHLFYGFAPGSRANGSNVTWPYHGLIGNWRSPFIHIAPGVLDEAAPALQTK